MTNVIPLAGKDLTPLASELEARAEQPSGQYAESLAKRTADPAQRDEAMRRRQGT